MKKVEVRSVDTDVIVILIGVFYELVKTQSSADIILTLATSNHLKD